MTWIGPVMVFSVFGFWFSKSPDPAFVLCTLSLDSFDAVPQ